LAYVGNVVRGDSGNSGIDSSDDLPFIEMVQKVPAENKKVDVYLATRGGSAHQVSRFVNSLRARFDEIDFIIPSFCMSAGTLFALSGDNIWMTERACLGPIDPQVPTKDGRYVPAQALLLLIDQLQQ
jgi:ClpP class serine protease